MYKTPVRTYISVRNLKVQTAFGVADIIKEGACK